MKRSVILILTLILLISMVSCARKSVDKKDDINDTKNNESNRDIMAESNSELNVIENGNDQERLEDVKFYPEGAELDFTTISYFSWNGDGIFKVPHLSDLGVQEYLDNRVVPTVDIDFFGRVYTFEYETTANLSTSNYTVHVYKLPESHTTKIMVNAYTGKIVEYVSMPFDNNLITEVQYQDFIKEFIDDFYDSKYDLSKYTYSCSTHFYRDNDNSHSTEDVSYFKTLGSNESLGWYTFLYRKFIDDIETNEQLAVTFFNDSISFEVLDFGYKEDTFKQVVPNLKKLEPHIRNYFKSIIKSEYQIDDITITDYSMFIKDRIPYVMATVEMKVTKIGSQNQWEIDVTEVAQIVCKLVEKE